MKSFFKNYYKFFLITLLSSFFFLFLYFFDNKYTYTGTQPANGILILTEEDLNTQPLRYLCRGWCFYPDVLLTPDDFSNGNSHNYMVYRNIGQQTNFAANYDNNPHGCGTYILHLVLPDKAASYALELPEIFSAYQLYINETCILQVGDPSPEHYNALTQNRMVTFEAEGSVDILLAVSDYSHFYSGLVYPPAFGTMLTLNITRFIRMGIALVISTLAFIIALLSFYFGIHMKKQSALLFAVLCLITCFSHSYGLLHSLFELPVSPWYAIEVSLYYLIVLIIILLQNRLCKVSFFPSTISTVICILTALTAFFYGFYADKLTIPLMQLFSVFLLSFKAGIAIYLLTTAFFSMQEQVFDTYPLIVSSIFYACAFIWDRLLPNYEPIYGGWFAEWGSFLFVLSIGYILWKNLVHGYSYGLAFAEENRQITRQLAMQAAYSKQIEDYIEINRKLNHDFRHHLRTIASIAQKNDDTTVLNYLKEIEQLKTTMLPTTPISFCSNPVLNALLRYYYNAANEQQIKIDFKLDLPEKLPLSDVEICSILGNLLENAIEACLRKPSLPRSITLKTRRTQFTLFLLLENTYDGTIKMQNNQFLSQKTCEKRFGIGLASVHDILQRHHGTLDIYPEQEVFKVGISLPLSSYKE